MYPGYSVLLVLHIGRELHIIICSLHHSNLQYCTVVFVLCSNTAFLSKSWTYCHLALSFFMQTCFLKAFEHQSSKCHSGEICEINQNINGLSHKIKNHACNSWNEFFNRMVELGLEFYTYRNFLNPWKLSKNETVIHIISYLKLADTFCKSNYLCMLVWWRL